VWIALFWIATIAMGTLCVSDTNIPTQNSMQMESPESFHTLRPRILFSNDNTVPKTALAAAICMIRNEPDILPYWIRYYSSLFGLENIAVVDHLSDDSITLDILSKWQAKGLKVIKYDGHFYRKGEFVTEVFQRHFQHVHLAIPADADEFLMPYKNDHPFPDKKLLGDTLKKMAEDPITPCWSMEQYFHSYNFFYNDTVGNITYFRPFWDRDVDVAKKFAKLTPLKVFNHGFHTVELKNDRPGQNANCSNTFNQVGFLHYHHRSPMVTAQRALNDVVGFGYLDRKRINLQNIAEQKDFLEKWVKKGRVAGYHKMNELLTFINQGPKGLLHDYSRIMGHERISVVESKSLDAILTDFESQPPIA
jgi:hypothetical protein